MRIADLTIGMKVAVVPNLRVKHLNVVPPEGLNPLDAFRIVYTEQAMKRWNHYARRGAGFHLGQVAEAGLWWGGRRSGVLLHVEVPDDEEVRVFLPPEAVPLAPVIVPASMLGDLDEALLEVETHRLHLERGVAEIKARMGDLREKRDRLRRSE